MPADTSVANPAPPPANNAGNAAALIASHAVCKTYATGDSAGRLVLLCWEQARGSWLRKLAC